MAEIDFSEELASVINGTSASDRIFGSRFSDKIEGLGGNDSINGFGSDDSIYGNDGNDTISSVSHEDNYDPYSLQITYERILFDGGAGADFLQGRRSVNAILNGGSGNDTLFGAGRLSGQEGDDVYTVYGDTARIVDTSGRSVIYSYVARSLESSIAASITTGALDDYIEAGKLVRAGAGNDYIGPDRRANPFSQVSHVAFGEEGDDTVEARTAYGGEGNDLVIGGFADGGLGNDTLRGSGVLLGGAGDDRYEVPERWKLAKIVDLEGSSAIVGVVLDDYDLSVVTYTGNAHVGRVELGNGSDLVNVRADLIIGGGGNDTLSFGIVVYAGDGNDVASGVTVYGGAGNDVITATVLGEGGAGDDTLMGSGVLRGGAGDDTYTPGAIAVLQHDIIDVEGRSVITGAFWTASDATILTGSLADRIEIGARLVRSGAGDDTVRGAHNIEGGDGNDSLRGIEVHGEAGNDTVEAVDGSGGTGNDRIVILVADGHGTGGAGNDTLVGRGALDGGAGDDRYEVIGPLSHDIIDREGMSDVVGHLFGRRTNLVETGDAADTVAINAGVVRSHGGNDTVKGGLQIWGGEGDDVLQGHVVEGEGGNDTVTAVRGGGGDGDDTVHGSVVAHGGAGNDVLKGGKTFGAKGNDTIEATVYADGGAGHDVITGGDTVLGGSGNDTVAGGGIVHLGLGDDQGAGVTVFGDDGNDVISGTAVASGGSGSDTLRFTAGQGTTLTGGEGADVFALQDYLPVREGVATVTDFKVGTDLLDLSELEWWRADVTWLRRGDDIAIRDGEGVTIVLLQTDDGLAFNDLSIVV